MKITKQFYCRLLCMSLLYTFLVHTPGRSQDVADTVVQESQRYIELKSKKLRQYYERVSKIDKKLKKQVSKKELKMLRQLEKEQPEQYKAYLAQRAQDSINLANKVPPKNSAIDSLRKVKDFAKKISTKAKSIEGTASKTGVAIDELDAVKGLDEQWRKQWKQEQLLKDKTKQLSGLENTLGIPSAVALKKQIFYAKEQAQYWKKKVAEPDEAEAAALEYLQGSAGFDQAMKNTNNANAYGGLGNDATAADLKRMGYQTKDQVNQQLQDKFRGQLDAVQQQLQQQLKDYTKAWSGGLDEKINTVKENVQKGKALKNEVQQTIQQGSHIEKPEFKVNPERKKPFWYRFEKQYIFQTTRADADLLKPAMLHLGMSYAFKHTPRLQYGVGIAGFLGLGKDFQNIKFSYEGISLRVFADWKWQYGISAQLGYERSFIPNNKAYLNANIKTPTTENNPLQQAFGGSQQIGYIGIMKRYKINSQWFGTLMLGYDLLHNNNSIQSPWLLRFGWGI